MDNNAEKDNRKRERLFRNLKESNAGRCKKQSIER